MRKIFIFLLGAIFMLHVKHVYISFNQKNIYIITHFSQNSLITYKSIHFNKLRSYNEDIMHLLYILNLVQ